MTTRIHNIWLCFSYCFSDTAIKRTEAVASSEVLWSLQKITQSTHRLKRSLKSEQNSFGASCTKCFILHKTKMLKFTALQHQCFLDDEK